MDSLKTFMKKKFHSLNTFRSKTTLKTFIMKVSLAIFLVTISLITCFQKVYLMRLESMLERCEDTVKDSSELDSTFKLCLRMIELLKRKRKFFQYEFRRESLPNIENQKEKERLYQIFSKINRLSGMRRIGRGKVREANINAFN